MYESEPLDAIYLFNIPLNMFCNRSIPWSSNNSLQLHDLNIDQMLLKMTRIKYFNVKMCNTGRIFPAVVVTYSREDVAIGGIYTPYGCVLILHNVLPLHFRVILHLKPKYRPRRGVMLPNDILKHADVPSLLKSKRTHMNSIQ